VLVLSACGTKQAPESLPGRPTPTASPSASPSPSPSPSPDTFGLDLLPDMPPPLRRDDAYAAVREGLSPVVKDFPELVYVPNGKAGTVTVFDAHL
jgi:hypothetical protein